MRKRGSRNISKADALHERKTDTELENLQDVLGELRQSYYTAAEKPAFYWKKQRDNIAAKLGAPVPSPVSRFRFAYLWAPAAAVALLCLFFIAVNSKAPAPDLAAGYDQDLLVEVEQALDRDYPLALRPAALLAGEIEQGTSVKQ